MIELTTTLLEGFIGSTINVQPLAILIVLSLLYGLIYGIVRLLIPNQGNTLKIWVITLWLVTCIYVLTTFDVTIIGIVNHLPVGG